MGRQLGALVRKNVLLLRRAPVATALEVVSPALIALAMAAVWLTSGVDREGTQQYATSHKATVMPLGVLSARLALAGQYLVVAPASAAQAPLADALTEWLTAQYPAFDGAAAFPAPDAPAALRSLYIPRLADRILAFDSDAALEAFIRSDGYSVSAGMAKVWAAIVVNAGLPTADYSLRFNASEVVATDAPATNNLQQGADFTVVDDYVADTPSFGDNLSQQTPPSAIQAARLPGFMSLQLAVDRFLLNRTLDGGPAGLNATALLTAAVASLSLWNPEAAAALPAYAAAVAASNASAAAALDAALRAWLAAEAWAPQQVDVIPFPTLAYTSNAFFASVDTVLPLFLTLAYMYPVSRAIRALVVEKEGGIRESLRVMVRRHDAGCGHERRRRRRR